MPMPLQGFPGGMSGFPLCQCDTGLPTVLFDAAQMAPRDTRHEVADA
jgi:hypothetical protein